MITRIVKLAKFFFQQRIVGFEVSDEPHLDPETLAWFSNRLARSRSYLEFGGGGSTRLAGRLGIPTISVEGDRYFARAIRTGLARDNRVELLDAKIGITVNWGVPIRGRPTPARIHRWRRYVNAPFALLKASDHPFPDLVLIDGRFRRACALRTAIEARAAGAECDLLMDDYYVEGREHYHELEQVLGSPERIGRSALFRLPSMSSIASQAAEEAIGDYR